MHACTHLHGCLRCVISAALCSSWTEFGKSYLIVALLPFVLVAEATGTVSSECTNHTCSLLLLKRRRIMGFIIRRPCRQDEIANNI